MFIKNIVGEQLSVVTLVEHICIAFRRLNDAFSHEMRKVKKNDFGVPASSAAKMDAGVSKNVHSID